MSLERLLILPDTHSPYEDKRAWKLAMKVGRAFKPDILVHLGDLGDFYAVSSFSKDPTRVSQLDEELRSVRKLRAEMDRLGAARKIFVCGNHEDRLRRYLQQRAPELFGMFDIDALLELSVNGWEYIPYHSSVKVGRLNITHDCGQSGKHTTSRALDTFGHSVTIGHHHAQQYVIEGNALGKPRVGFQPGWLGDASKVDYMHRIKVRRNWSLGFGVGYLEKETGNVHLTPCPIVGYTVCLNGRLFRG